MNSLHSKIAIVNVLIVLFFILLVTCKKEERPIIKPVASFTISPEEGNLSTIFTVDASTCTDEHDSIDDLKIRWKWEDNVMFTEWSYSKYETFNYTTSGSKIITLEVEDTDGASASIQKIITVIENQAPTASFVISPNSGNSTTVFQFDATSSTDDVDDITALQVRWQWENGGSWTDWAYEKIVSHTFNTAGTKEIILEVKDTKELVGSTNKSLTVFCSLTVNIIPDGGGLVLINPNNPQYEFNTEVSLAANANLGYYFSEWSGDATGSSNPFTITMNSNKLIDASFEEGVIEDFNDGIADYFTTDGSGRWNTYNNAYKMSGAYASTTAYSCYPYNFNDFGLSVDMKVTNSTALGHAFGIYFKSQGTNMKVNSYRLSIAKSGKWYLGKYINGNFYYITDNWVFSNALYTGLNSVNKIEILFVGTLVEIYFNNIYQGYASNMSNFASGYIGVQGFDSDESYNAFVFDNFIITTSDLKSSKITTINNNLKNIKGIKGDPEGINF